jgi:hypothetical protein
MCGPGCASQGSRFAIPWITAADIIPVLIEAALSP